MNAGQRCLNYFMNFFMGDFIGFVTTDNALDGDCSHRNLPSNFGGQEQVEDSY